MSWNMPGPDDEVLAESAEDIATRLRAERRYARIYEAVRVLEGCGLSTLDALDAADALEDAGRLK